MISKKDIVTAISKILLEHGPAKSPAALASLIVDDVFSGMASALVEGKTLVLPGIGRIKPKDVAAKPAKPARPGRNPRTGEAIQIEAKPAQPAYKSAKIRPAKELLEMLNA
jgi:nucleoid DNA-binding protein